MGQKTNALGFRLGTSQSHHSIWFAKPKKYSEELQEDKKIRNCIQNYVQKNKKTFELEGLVCIEIQKRIDVIKVIIYFGFIKGNIKKEDRPKIILPRIKELKMNVEQELNCMNRKTSINIIKIAKPYGHPNILAEYIAVQLKNRVSFGKAMRAAVERATEAHMRGIQKFKGILIQIKGRIPGKDRKRIEWIREGIIPLQTARAKIDYCAYPITTLRGVIGIKIWIFIDKE
uniref:ribosomal protein S3 n=1 Tax=Triadenum breviflorum TaxID=1157646 RepID=UPI0020012743|nr:ribosomal protein S3 [Triadenum breviflorum]UNQ87261.1 ribosomal protein S3 [Triadenum breviflorum]